MDDTERPAAEAIALITAAWHSDEAAASVIIEEDTLHNPIISCAVLAGAAGMFLKIIEANTSEEHAAELLQTLALATTNLDDHLAAAEAELDLQASRLPTLPPWWKVVLLIGPPMIVTNLLTGFVLISLLGLWGSVLNLGVGAATGFTAGYLLLRRWRKKIEISP